MHSSLTAYSFTGGIQRHIVGLELQSYSYSTALPIPSQSIKFGLKITIYPPRYTNMSHSSTSIQ